LGASTGRSWSQGDGRAMNRQREQGVHDGSREVGTQGRTAAEQELELHRRAERKAARAGELSAERTQRDAELACRAEGRARRQSRSAERERAGRRGTRGLDRHGSRAERAARERETGGTRRSLGASCRAPVAMDELATSEQKRGTGRKKETGSVAAAPRLRVVFIQA
jgi:hypothetical protein